MHGLAGHAPKLRRHTSTGGTIAAATLPQRLAALGLIIMAGMTVAGPVRAADRSATPTSNAIYVGLDGGYVYQRTEGSATWQESNLDLTFPVRILSLAVSPAGRTVYAGTSDVGVYVSNDGGKTWDDDNGGAGGPTDTQINGLAISATNSQFIYAVSSLGGYYVSGDGGTHWTASKLPYYVEPSSIALNQRAPGVVLVGTVDRGILRSTDDGAHWTESNMPVDVSVESITFDPRSADVAYATTRGQLFQTIDGGVNWQPDVRGIPDRTWITAIGVDPRHPGRVIGGTNSAGFYLSEDGGTSWRRQSSGNGLPVNSIAFDAAHPGVVFAGSDDGTRIYRSDDSGTTWSSSPSGFKGDGYILSIVAADSEALPTNPVAAPAGNPAGVRYFAETHHTVSGAFLRFFNANSGLKFFGLPLTESYATGSGYQIQYFERAQLFLLHGRVSMASLGVILTMQRNFPAVACCPASGWKWFSGTGHTLSGRFLSFWMSHNGAVLFGLPRSEPLYEMNGDGTGRTYLVQYFSNARMEYHPELAGTGNEVTLGLVGKETLQNRGWL
jgi:photosystem II stability/assembly factor-like uncharacterized protein